MVASPQPPGEDFAPPAGWTWHRDDSGFRIAVPVGWRYFREDGVSCFQDPRSDRALSVDPATSVTGDLVKQLRAEEQRDTDAASCRTTGGFASHPPPTGAARSGSAGGRRRTASGYTACG